jgi:hypothetical protein
LLCTRAARNIKTLPANIGKGEAETIVYVGVDDRAAMASSAA